MSIRSIYILIIVIASLSTWSCNKVPAEKEKVTAGEVPTSFEQHSSGMSSSTGGTAVTSTSSSSSGNSSAEGPPVSFSLSSSSQNDSLELTSIRDLANDDNKALRDFLKDGAIKLLLEDKVIETESDRINLSITDQGVIVNRIVLSDEQSKRYIDLLKSKMTLGEIFNYTFNQF